VKFYVESNFIAFQVFLAKKIRDEIEFIRRESLKAGQVPNSTLMGENLVRGDNSYTVVKAPSLSK